LSFIINFGVHFFQLTPDKMLDEVSKHIFDEACSNKMIFRQKINDIKDKTSEIKALVGLLMNEHLLFSKDYRDHGGDIENFLENHMKHFLRELHHEQ
jgi:hypothetical protein